MKEYGVTTDWLKARAKASPDTAALLIDGRTWTFAQLDTLTSRLCNFLADRGIQPGDHLGLLAPNSLAVVCAVFAAARLGAVLVPLNTRLTPTELAWQVERADCARLLCATTTAEQAWEAAAGQLPVIALPQAADAFEEALATWPASFDKPVAVDLDSLQAIVFTSGTTGFPKGAMISFANHFWSAVGSAFRLGVRPEDSWLACLPLYHVGGLAVLFRSCLYGTAVVLQPGFDTRAVLDSLREEAITLVSLVPTMLERLLREGLDTGVAPSLRLILLGGSSAAPELLARAADAGLPVAATYGLTEAASQVATLMPGEERGKPGSVGRPLLFTEIDVVDEEGRPAGANEVGEIVVTGPTVMCGYYKDQAATANALDDERLHTGDVGYVDEDGNLWVLDRRSDLIISGGENVYPAEVERVLRGHPAVAQACVVGLPHPVWGQQVTALVVLQTPNLIAKSELLAFSRERLAGFKQPRVLVFVDRLPQTGSGKIQRRAAATQLITLMEPE